MPIPDWLSHNCLTDMTSQPLTGDNDAELQPHSPQVQLEKWMTQIGGDRATAGKWSAGASSFLANRFAETFLDVCKREAAASRVRAKAFGTAWALLDNDKAVEQAAFDALFFLISEGRDQQRLSKVAATIGKRTEMLLFLLHPQWGGSWHLKGLRLANGRNLGVGPMLQRLKAKGFKHAEQYKPLPAVERQALGRLFVEIVQQTTGMIKVEKVTIRGRSLPRIVMTDLYWEFLRRWKQNLLAFRPAKMPMIEPPRPYLKQYDGGWFTIASPSIDIPPERWAHATRHMQPCVLGSLNVLQATPLAWNHGVMNLQRAIWSQGHQVGMLPARERLPYPDKTQYLASDDKENRLKDYWDAVWKCKADRRMNTLRSDFINNRVTYHRLIVADEMWFKWKKDRRGRAYQEGGNVGYLKSDPWRSQLQSTQGARIEGHVAEFGWALGDAVGLPKSVTARRDWMLENEEHIIDAGRNPVERLAFWESAKEPWRLISLCREWAAYEDNPSHETHLLFQLDQTCSAYGHAACLTSDAWLAEQTNVIGSKYNDLYEQLRATTKALMLDTGNALIKPVHREMECLRWWNDHGIGRDLVKKAVMPVLYGRSHQTLIQGINEYLRDELDGFIDRENDNLRAFDLSICLSKYIHSSVKGLLPSVGALSGWLREIAKAQMDRGHRPYWLTPNGLLVESYSNQSNTQKFELMLSGRTVRFQCDDKEGTPLDRRRSLTKITADFIHSMDAAFLERFVWHWGNTYKKPIVTVHDCMATTLDNVDTMRLELHDQFSRFYSEDHLRIMHYNLERELGCKLPSPPRQGDLDIHRIGENGFLFG